MKWPQDPPAGRHERGYDECAGAAAGLGLLAGLFTSGLTGLLTRLFTDLLTAPFTAPFTDLFTDLFMGLCIGLRACRAAGWLRGRWGNAGSRGGKAAHRRALYCRSSCGTRLASRAAAWHF